MFIDLDEVKLTIGSTPILKGVSLSLQAGEIYGLLGPNGAGKSTTISTALGLLKPEAGTARLFGQDPCVAGERLRSRVGVLPEHNGFYDWMSADRYLSFYGQLYGRLLSPSEIERRLTLVGLVPRARQQIGTYSRGMRQRLGLARALIADPELIVLDEPTNGLDPRGRRDVHDVLMTLAANGAAILLCTHLLDDVERLCSRIGFIVDGRTVAQGQLSKLLAERGQGRQFRLRLSGSPPAIDVDCRPAKLISREGEWAVVDIDPSRKPEDVWREMMFRGWPIVEIERAKGGLEDLYLDLTAAPTEPHGPQRRAA